MSATYGIPADVPLTRTEPAMRPITPSALPSGSTNNYNPTDATNGIGFHDAQLIRQATNAAGSTLTGLDASLIADGQYVVIENHGSGTLTLVHESASSTDANRFTLPGAENMAIDADSAVMLVYDEDSERWRPSSGVGSLLDGSVTLGKMADIATARVLGRTTSGAGSPEALTATQAMDLIGAARTLTAGTGLSGGGTLAADRTIAIANTGVTAAAYDMPTLTVNAQGQVTAAKRLVFNVKSFGAAGDDSTDDLSAFESCITAAAAAANGEQAIIVIPEGEYVLGRDGSSSWSLDISADNLIFQGVPGRSIIKHPTGMPDASVAIVRADVRSNLEFRDLVFDGNWGAESGVTDSDDGINHTTQADPKNYGLMIRGSTNIKVVNCTFQQTYGDGIWMGARSDDDFDVDYWSQDILIIGCRFNLCARNGISLGAAQRNVTIAHCKFTDIFTTAIDSEPQSLRGHSRDVTVFDNDIGGWWDPANGGSANLLMSVVGGYTTGQNQASAARGWRILDNRIHGCTMIATAIDVVMRGNRIAMAPDGETGTFRAPIFIDHSADDITIEDNYIYDNAPLGTFASHIHNGAIEVQHYSATGIAQPAGVRIKNNRIHARNGVHGIFVNGVGGFAYADAQPVQAPTSGTASSVTDATLTHTGAGWSTNRWAGWTVIMGGKVALIESNTSEVLTLVEPTLTDIAWHTPLGTLSSTPSAGAYRIVNTSGVCDIEGNDIDCSFDGNTAGGNGIYLYNDRAGGRIRVHNNKIKNSGSSSSGGGGTWGIYVVGDTSKPVLYLELTDNKFWDDQPSVSMAAGIRFSAAASLTSITKLVMHGNSMLGGATTLLSNVSSGTWLLRDGTVQEWAGYGAPESVVTAPVGSTYRRINGSGGTVLYVKNSGTGNTGWVPVGGVVASGTITCVAKASLADTDYMTIGDGIQAPVLYEFDTAGDGVTAGRVQVDVSGDTTAADVAATLKSAIEANQPSIAVTDNEDGTLSLAHKLAGTIGNVSITENVANAGFTVSGLSGGVDPAR